MTPPRHKVRILFRGGGIVHAVSRTRPEVIIAAGVVADVRADWVEGAGDTFGFIDWREVSAVTWRREGAAARADRALESASPPLPGGRPTNPDIHPVLGRRRSPAGARPTATDRRP